MLMAAREASQGFGQHRRRSGVYMQPGAGEGGLQEVVVQLVVVLHVLLLATALHLVEGRLGNVDVALVDQIRHVAEEERQQQGADVRTVNVRIRHDDDVVVAQLLKVELAAVGAAVLSFTADAATERRDEGGHFLGRQHLVETGLLDVQDLAAQRQNRLCAAISPLLGRATGGVAFHQIELG